MNDIEVLIVGAGPTGLVLALVLARHGVTPRIVEKNPGPGEASRAMAVHARTLEFYSQLGFADEVVGRGIQMKNIHIRRGARDIAQIRLNDFGQGISPFPFVVSLPQDEHERLLVELLTAAGVEVKWNTELVDFDDGGQGVRATIRRDGVPTTLEASYLVGCDGARSTVRRRVGIGFPGGTYEQVFFVADVEATGAAVDNDDVNTCLTRNGFHLVFPIRTSGMHRLIGIVPEELQEREPLSFEDLRAHMEEAIDVRVQKVNWFSRYQSHHRVADNFRAGRVFIAGDAGHIHSPMGGQGMNTGIGDAVNLAWKLAAVVAGKAAPALLDSYEPERIAFARSLVATTDRVFQVVAGQTAAGRIFRGLMPSVAARVTRLPGVPASLFRVVSQTRIDYRESPISEGSAGDVRGGDRLPWTGGDGHDNFEPLASFDWQIHVYGTAAAALRQAAHSLRLPLHELPWTERAEAAGLARDALYLVRPDGYVALADAGQDVEALRAYMSKLQIGPGAPPPGAGRTRPHQARDADTSSRAET